LSLASAFLPEQQEVYKTPIDEPNTLLTNLYRVFPNPYRWILDRFSAAPEENPTW